MIIRGKSQYRAVVQGIPPPIAKLLQKRINTYMWNGKPPGVNKQTMSEPPERGGKKVLDIEALKESIDLMRLKRYLTLERDKRPLWAYINDDLMKKNIPKSRGVEDPAAAVNPFLQTWTPAKYAARNKLPASIHNMIKTAQKHNLQFTPPTPTNEMKKTMPAWFHINHNPQKVEENGTAQRCLRHHHSAITV
ncbi:hypothetical protein BKA70DRAFT_1115573, partial [Coprinopsis sp. MPI-PUGE-AT-0042]